MNRPDITAAPLRILLIGDCNTSGVEAEPQDNIGVVLKDLLADQGRETQITNLSAAMYTSREGIQRAQRVTQPHDVLILNFGLVDAWTTSLPQFYVLNYPTNPLRKFARKMLKSLKKRLRSDSARRIIPAGHVVPLPEYAANLRTIIAHIQETSPNIKLILWGTAPVPTDPSRNEDIKRYNTKLQSLAQQMNAPYIDTHTCIKHISTEKAYKDAVHLTHKAQKATAQCILKHL